MSWKISPKSGDEAWTWATVEGAGAAVVPPLVEFVCDWALVAALPSPALVAMAEGASGPPDGLEMVA